MNRIGVQAGVAVLCGLFAVGVTQADDGFSWSSLNPFGGQKKASSSNEGFSLVSKKPAPKPQKPPVWSTWGRNTSRAISQTTDFLNPWKKRNKMPATRPPLTGSRTVSNGSSFKSQSQAQQGNWFTRLFQPAPQPEAPRTVQEWVGQSRPTLR